MKWVCLMANMMVPGVGSMIAKRYVAGAIQAVVSDCVRNGGHCFSEFYAAMKDYSESLDDPDEMAAAMKSFSARSRAAHCGWSGGVDSEGDVDLGAVYHGCGV